MLKKMVLDKIEELNKDLMKRRDVPEKIKIARSEKNFYNKYGQISFSLLKLLTFNTYKEEDGIANFMLRAIITVFFVFIFAGTLNPHMRIETIMILSLLFSGVQSVLFEFFAIEMENNETEICDDLISKEDFEFLINIMDEEELEEVKEKYKSEIRKSDLLLILEKYLTSVENKSVE